MDLFCFANAAWGTDLGTIFVVNTDTGDVLAQWRAHFGKVEALSFSPDNTVIGAYSESEGQDVHVFAKS